MGERIFTTDWFSMNIPKWQTFLRPLKDKPDLCGLEIGVFQGRSTCWLLDNIFTHPKSRLDVVDTFEGSVEHIHMDQRILTSLYDTFMHNTVDHRERVTAHRMKSADFLRSTQNIQQYDFIYVDGDHHSYACLEDMVLSWPLLKSGGTMIIDDYGGGEPDSPKHEIPRHGIDAFLHAYTTRYDILDIGYQVVLKKIF